MKILWSLLISFCFYEQVVFGSKTPPIFSSTYITSGTLHIPYADLQEPFYAWYDAFSSNSRIDYYGGMVKTFQTSNHLYGIAKKIVPVATESGSSADTCFISTGTNQKPVNIQSVLPDLTHFKFIGNDIINGDECEVWRNAYTVHDKVNTYTMYLTRKKYEATNDIVIIPLMYEMKGVNTLFGSHYDHYFLTYTNFTNDSPDPSVFSNQEGLTCEFIPFAYGTEHHHYVKTFNPMQEFINNDVRHVDHAWDEFNKHHRKMEDYESQKEYHFRKHIFHQNYRYIQSKNRANLGFRLAMNHLADRTSEELRYLRGSIPSYTSDIGSIPFPYSSHTLSKIKRKLPDNLDWRLFGAVTSVKDQAVCGSCWSFSTTGAIEGAYFLKTGRRVRLSEQALIDCSWPNGNGGCDGGFQTSAYRWIMKHGGIPSDADYGSYLGQDSYCHIENITMTAKISGYVRVTPKSEVALQTALVKHGPIAISVDASPKSFSFYSSGVYYEPECRNTSDSLNHAVLLVGYGNINGVPYWLVKNSWSNYWGNDGYMLISRKNNNCGVMTAPTYVTM